MADSTLVSVSTRVASPAARKRHSIKPISPVTKPTYSPKSKLVNVAFKALKKHGGSSVQAVKKYFRANNKVKSKSLKTDWIWLPNGPEAPES